MNIEDYISDALQLVSAWELPEEEIATAVNDQARLMAGLHMELSCDLPICSPYASLRF